jgi:hypothetical protein
MESKSILRLLYKPEHQSALRTAASRSARCRGAVP